MTERERFETWELLLETIRHLRRFRPRQSTHRVDKPASRLQPCDRMSQELFLQLGQFSNIGWGRRPARVRIAVPGPQAAARRIQQNPVESSARGQMGIS